MKTVISSFLLGVIILNSCVKDTVSQLEGHWIDENYPTTYHQMPPSVINNLTALYLKDKDSCFQTSLNTYGFCASSANYNFNCEQPCHSVSKQQAHDMTMDFLAKNKNFTGTSDTSLTKIISYFTFGMSSYCNRDSTTWNVTIGNQVVKGLKIEGTGIYLRINHDGVREVTGNWYPVVSIPANDALTYEMAKAKLIGKKFDFMCWSTIHIEIDQNTQWVEPQSRKIIYPFYRNNSIELHVVWVLDPGGFSFYVDVMNGEILGSFMNFVCAL